MNRGDLRALLLALAALAGLTLVDAAVLHLANAATVAVSFLFVVLLTAARARFRVAAVVSVVAMLTLNFFFIPPIGTLRVADPQNWIALLAFVAVALAASNLAAAASARERQAVARAALAEERRSAELARRGDAAKSAVLASLAHDLKTPLTALGVAAGNLQAPWLTEAERRDQAEIIGSETARLTWLFDNILDLAHIESGGLAATREWVPASELIEAARKRVGPVLKDHPLDAADIDGTLVLIDPRVTSAALAHLLHNAARYSPPGAPVSISAHVTGEGLELTVRDRGPGIPDADLSRVFDRFYRGSRPTQPPGMGLGLTIARSLLAAEDGRISAANRAGGGAQFTIVVPAEARRAVELEPQP